LGTVRRFQQFTNDWPWSWRPVDMEELSAEARGRGRARSTSGGPPVIRARLGGQDRPPVPDPGQERQLTGGSPGERGARGAARHADLAEESQQRMGGVDELHGTEHRGLHRPPPRQGHQVQPVGVAAHREILQRYHARTGRVVFGQRHQVRQNGGAAGDVLGPRVQRRTRHCNNNASSVTVDSPAYAPNRRSRSPESRRSRNRPAVVPAARDTPATARVNSPRSSAPGVGA